MDFQNRIIYILLAFLLIPQIILGQVFLKGKVVDKETSAVLEAVKITSVDPNSTVVSDNQGFFNLKTKGKYQFSRKGYQTKYIEVHVKVFLVVQMDISPFELGEVVVHANQIPTSRKNAIASTEIVTKKDIA